MLYVTENITNRANERCLMARAVMDGIFRQTVMIHIVKDMPERVITEDENRLLSVDAGYLSKGNKVGASSLVTIADKCAEEAKQL